MGTTSTWSDKNLDLIKEHAGNKARILLTGTKWPIRKMRPFAKQQTNTAEKCEDISKCIGSRLRHETSCNTACCVQGVYSCTVDSNRLLLHKALRGRSWSISPVDDCSGLETTVVSCFPLKSILINCTVCFLSNVWIVSKANLKSCSFSTSLRT